MSPGDPRRPSALDLPSRTKSLHHPYGFRRVATGEAQLKRQERFLGFGSGLVAGITGVFVGQPLDLIKVHQQIYGSKAPLNYGLSQGAPPLPAWRKFRYLFRGIGPPLVTSGITQTINFGFYDLTLRYLRREYLRLDKGPLWHHFLSGAAGGLTISCITSPASLIKIQLQTATESLTYSAVIKSLASRGIIRGFYHAYIPDLMNQSLGRGVYMTTYEGVKRVMQALEVSDDVAPSAIEDEREGEASEVAPLHQRLIAGAISGMAGWITIYPLDVIKSRMMHSALDPHRTKYTGMLDCFAKTYRAGGMTALYSGLPFTLFRAIPVAGISLPVYDSVYHWLQRSIADPASR